VFATGLVARLGLASNAADMHWMSQNFRRRKTPASSSLLPYRFRSIFALHHSHGACGITFVGGIGQSSDGVGPGGVTPV